jgi:hypothetical protein
MNRALALSAITLMLIVTLTSSNSATHEALAQNDQSTIQNLPPGHWLLAILPAKTRGRVVDLSSVSSSVSKGLGVTYFILENRSKQRVAGVKIAWRLFEASRRDTTLLKGETPKFLAVPLIAGERRVVEYPVVSFAEIYRPLLRGKRELEGNYRIELRVSDVRFTDETAEQGSAAFLNVKKVNWKADPAVAFVEVKSEPAPPVDDGDLGCPDQVCSYDYNQKCYKCVYEQGGTCGWRSCTNCANGRCPGLIE